MFRSIDEFNAASREEAVAGLLACCGSTRWAQLIVDERPFVSGGALEEATERLARELDTDDWWAAFASHPRIGTRKETDSAPQETTADWSSEEQAGTRCATDQTRSDLARANLAYEEKFGHIFIICATGKSSEEMLALCRARLANDAATELQVAGAELRKIALLRLRKLMGSVT